jgi:hypothetical protein
MKYYSTDQVYSDLLLYTILTKGADLTLDLFPRLCQSKWQWIVDSWDVKLYPSLLSQVQGDDNQVKALTSLANDVKVVQLGGTYNPFDDATRTVSYKSILSLIRLSTVPLTIGESTIVRTESERVSKLAISDFEEMTNYLRTNCAIASQRIDLGDEDGIAALGVSTVVAYRSHNIDDLYLLEAALDTADFIDGIIFAKKQELYTDPDLLTAANLNIDPDSGVSIQNSYLSAEAVPFESSLEEMALRYLGSKERWFELATINKLQSPYVDLTGNIVYLIAPGSGSIVRIPSTYKDYLPVGVKIQIGSARYVEEVRLVNKIITNNDGTMTLELSGENDLSKFTVTELSFVRVFKPNTVNDRSMILVPKEVSPSYPRQQDPIINDLRLLDAAMLNFGVDAKRHELSGDLVVSAGGDLDITYGIPAVKQVVLYALKTSAGELPWHPEFGVPSNVGDVWAGTVDEGVVFARSIERSLMQDGRFAGVVLRDVKVTPSSIAMNFVVQIQGSNVLIPLSFIG